MLWLMYHFSHAFTISTSIPFLQFQNMGYHIEPSSLDKKTLGFTRFFASLVSKNADFSKSQPVVWLVFFSIHSIPWANIMTIPGSMIMSSDMWALSQAMTMTAWRPGTLRQMYCKQPGLVTSTILFQGDRARAPLLPSFGTMSAFSTDLGMIRL